MPTGRHVEYQKSVHNRNRYITFALVEFHAYTCEANLDVIYYENLPESV